MALRFIGSWFFFILGDIVSRILFWSPFENVEWPYNLYQWLMNMSDKIQGDGPGPWENVDKSLTSTSQPDK